MPRLCDLKDFMGRYSYFTGGKEIALRSHTVSLPISCVTIDKLFNFAELKSRICQMGTQPALSTSVRAE